MYPNITNSLREDFLLDPHVLYFNHGSYGATPRPVFESYQRWQRELENQPCDFFRRSAELLEQSRRCLAETLGTTSANLAYVVNATTGLNVVAHSLALSPGDEVLATNHEYGALDRTWRYMGQRQGYKYINHPISLPVTTPEDFVERLWEGVTPRTRVIFISHITSPTALITPVQEICRRAREQGILTVIDGAHAPGQIPLNLDELGADFYSGNLHKWLCAPKGAGFLYARTEMMHYIEPLVISWGYQSDHPGPSPLVDYVEMQGTRDLSAFLAVPDAIQYYKDHNWEAVRARCHAILEQTVREIADLSRTPLIAPLGRGWFSQMACAPLPDFANPADLRQRLYDEYHIEIPVGDWNGHKLSRISVQAYNTPEEAQTLVEAYKTLLRL